MEQQNAPPSEAWQAYTERGLITTLGPLYKLIDPGGIAMGLRIDERHCNPMGVCHGGTLMTFADVCLGSTVIHSQKLESPIVPTINLGIDFLAAAKLGGWIEGRGRILRTTRNLVFIDGLIVSEEKAVARVNAIFKIS